MFTKNVNSPDSTAVEGVVRRRGRPAGRTLQGDETRHHLYATAVKLIAAHGYEATTLRDVARVAGVSPGLLYKYFPSKRAVVLELYDELSAEYSAHAQQMGKGNWRDRFLFGLKTSLAVLGPHRATLVALTPILVGDADEGLFASSTAFSRLRVQKVFRDAVLDATDTPKTAVAEPLGRALYLLHLMFILLWLLDKSAKQRATAALVALLPEALASIAFALRLRPIRTLLISADRFLRESLFGEAVTGNGD